MRARFKSRRPDLNPAVLRGHPWRVVFCKGQVSLVRDYQPPLCAGLLHFPPSCLIIAMWLSHQSTERFVPRGYL